MFRFAIPPLTPPRPLLSCALGASLFCTAALAQDVAAPRAVVPTDVGEAILLWVAAFDAGELRLPDDVPVEAKNAVDYVRLGVRGGALSAARNAQSLSNFAILQQLVAVAEEHPSPATVDALLALASTGLATDMFDHQIAMVRELGHFALLRMHDPAVWDHLHAIATADVAAAATDEVKTEAPAAAAHAPAPGADAAADAAAPAGPTVAEEDRAELEHGTRGMWRVAAVRLLGLRRQGVFRSSIEKCLLHRDGRLRLAAAEALRELHQAESLPTVTRVLSGETHPMVALALVEAMHAILEQHLERIDAERANLALRMALSRLGEVDWRSDMAIVRLIQSHPLREAVQPMIALMRNARGQSDPILKIINANASLWLSGEALLALKRITGAGLGDDPDAWQAFWDAEKDRIVVRRPTRPVAGGTVATMSGGNRFYGIPVLGSNVVFVLDTSGSMDAEVELPRGPVTGPGRGAGKNKAMRGSRLRIACRQTLKALQGMPEHAKFSIVTFKDTVRAWNRQPVQARRSARERAASVLGDLRPRGGTNVFDALVHVLEASDVGYGEATPAGVDEVFLLSDGEPTAGELTEPAAILEAVREINRVRRARINTVFAGVGHGAELMRQLAEQNGGVFVQQ